MKLADALKAASTNVSTIGGGRLEERPPGELGVFGGGKVDTGPPVEHESRLVGSLEGVAVIPAADPDPVPYEAGCPPANPALAAALHDTIIPRRPPRKDEPS